MSAEQNYKELEKQIEANLEKDLGTILNRSELGELNFNKLETHFEELQKLSRHLKSIVERRLLPDSVVRQLQSQLNQANNVVNRMESFKLDAQNPKETYDQLCTQFMQAFYELVTHSGPAMAVFSSTAQASSEASSIVEELRTNRDESLQVLEVMREQSAKGGVSKYGPIFKAEADEHSKAAKVWLGVTAALSVVTVVFAGIFLWFAFSHSSISTPALVAKFFLLSLLTSGTFWIGKIYKTHRHLAVVNRHRQNALESFETFVNATEDSDVKNAILQ
jgi:hypothetical protein